MCRKIKKEELHTCCEKLRIVKFIKKSREEARSKLEEKRKTIINFVNRIIDEEKKKCGGLEAESKIRNFEKKMDYIKKMTTCLDSNIAAYNDFDLLEMEQAMLSALAEVDSFNVDTFFAVAFVPGKIKEEVIRGLIGSIPVEETQTKVNTSASVCEIKTIHQLKDYIITIAPLSDTQAWVSDERNVEIKLLSSQSKDIHCRKISRTDFITLPSGDFIVTYYSDQVVRRVTTAGKESVIVSTKPLHPTWIRKTQKDGVLVTLRDNGDHYKLQPSSRRLLQRMTLSGKVLHTYEFRVDGVTRLFTVPGRTAENGNSDICAINRTSGKTGELIVLQGDGRVRTTYHGLEDSVFDPRDVTCDCNRRIIVLDCISKSLHLLSPDGKFLGYLLFDMSDYPETMALYQGSTCMWIGL